VDHLQGRVALITGAAGGIGRATARHFAGRGARVVLTARDPSKLQDVDLGTGAAGALRLRLDVADSAAWEEVVDRVVRECGRLDVLVNVAGIVQPALADALSLADLERHVAVNLLGTIHGCRAALRPMRAQGSGRIVNVASLGGIMPLPGEAAYCATKYGVRGYTFALHAELRGTGIGACVVSPDSTDTPQLDHELVHDEARMSFVDAPLQPEAVARAIAAATRTRRPEILVPGAMGLLARIAMAFPGLVSLLLPFLLRSGARRMARERRARGLEG
jgi:NAD(P)-dependent dehydrogenase (short-subunit alcohol dehydrogenase family)